MSNAPSRSLPPPNLPPEVVARTRVRALEAELQALDDDSAQAILRYEIGALSQHRLGDIEAAKDHYRKAYDLQPAFAPTLCALQRIYEAEHDHAQLDRILEARARVAEDARLRASILCEHAELLDTHLGQTQRGIELWRDALVADPSCQTASLMLDRRLSAVATTAERREVLSLRADQTTDPLFKSLLLRELSELCLAQDDVDASIAALQSAARLPQGQQGALLALERVARRLGRNEVLADALETHARLIGSIVRGEEPPADEDNALLGRSATAESHVMQAAILWREAGRTRAALEDGAAAATLDYEQAIHHSNALVLQLEYMARCAAAGELEVAAAQARSLLEAGVEGEHAALLHTRVAEFAAQQGDTQGQLRGLAEAFRCAPNSPVTTAALEDALSAAGMTTRLREHLLQRAKGCEGDERAACFLRAGVLTHEIGETDDAVGIFKQAADAASEPQVALREMFAAALSAGDEDAVQEAASRLCAEPIDDREKVSLYRERYVMLRKSGLPADDGEGEAGAEPTSSDDAARGAALCKLLREVLDAGICDDWAPDAARIHAPPVGDWALLARAHDRLATLADDDAGVTAHRCAAARAYVRGGAPDAAAESLRSALELVPDNDYAVTLIEELLLARGESAEAVQVLREAAVAQQDAARSELSLLHAGFAAERAGDFEAAVRNYEDATDRMPNLVSPLWALRRLADRTGDRELRMRALEGLSLCEGSLESAGIHSLELGEHFEAAGKPALAIQPLRAAMERAEVEVAAAVVLAQLPPSAVDADERGAALERLVQHSTGALRAALLQSQAVERLWRGEAEAARGLLAQIEEVGETRDDPWLPLAKIRVASDPVQRAAAFEQLSGCSTAADARGELLLHAMRTRMYAAPDAAHETLADLASAVEAADPGSLASAMALDEAPTPAGDARFRVGSLRARLTHSGPEQAPTLRAAHARALLLLGLHDQAMAESRRLLLRDESDLALWEVVRAAGYASQDFQAVLEANERLALACGAQLQAQLLDESARLLLDVMGDPAGAERQLRAALGADPTHQGAFDRLHDLLIDREAPDELLALLRARLETVQTTEDRVDLLYEASRLMRALDERLGALTALDELLALDGSHIGALGLKTEIHVSMKDYAEAVSALETLADSDLPDGQRRLARNGAADFLAGKLDDPGGAYRQLATLARDELAELATFERMGELASKAALHREAAEAYADAARLCSGTRRAAFERRAGAVWARDVEDRQAAAAAYDRALLALPTDLEACRALRDVLQDDDVKERQLRGFRREVVKALAAAPADPELLRAMRQLGVWQDDEVARYLADEALGALGLESDEGSPHRDGPPWKLRPWTPEELRGVRKNRDDGPAAQLAVLTCEAIAALRKHTPGDTGPGTAKKRGRGKDAGLRAALGAQLEVFGLSIGTLYVGGDDPRQLRVLPTSGAEMSWVVGASVTAPFTAAQRFEIGRQTMAFHCGVWPLFSEPRTRWRDLLCAAALAAEAPIADAGERAEVRQLAHELTRRMPRSVRNGLRPLGAAINRLDELATYLEAAELSHLRAGLLLAGELRPMLDHLLGGTVDLQRVHHSERTLDMLRFWTSPALVEAVGHADEGEASR